MYGEDKEDAVNVIDDDRQFDAWLARYGAKQRSKKKKAGGNPTVSKEAFFQKAGGQLPKPGRRDGTKPK